MYNYRKQNISIRSALKGNGGLILEPEIGPVLLCKMQMQPPRELKRHKLGKSISHSISNDLRR
ncbi:hypothetical protein TRIP_B200602 [uncultured Desulfatiglans sp.]|uniref:Uncharacterized protein n=1 Tax=Uncultured Desulfatiglans sp. TaxID=1748965 RepID=A0A653A479_UNCDX|nr:hypothetical protein TRIP_B200602 [uncultured Desulfatiglans sp.]